MATAQDVMLCELCDKFPLKMHCNKCAISLCKGCVAEHVISDITKAHEVVLYKMRNEDPVFQDCKTHSHQKCEMFCRECDIPLCVKCVASGSHMKHEVTEITEHFSTEKEKLEQKSKELENSVYPKYEESISEIENLISKVPESYEKLMSAISKHGEAWHREIDIIIKKTKQKVEKMKNQDLETLNKHLIDLKNLLSTVCQAIMWIRKILKSNNVTKIMNRSDETPEFRNPPKKVDIKPPTFVPSSIQGEQLHKMFGTLIDSSISEIHTGPTAVTAMAPEQSTAHKTIQHEKPTAYKSAQPGKQNLDSPKVVSSIDTKTGNLKSVACLSPHEVWICAPANKKIHRFHMDGSLQQTVTIKTGNQPTDITVTPKGELVSNVYKDRSIYIIRNKKTEKVITVRDWGPSKVRYTASGDLLVSMAKDDKTPKKVVRYRGSTEKQVIQFDQDGNPWFSTGSNILFIAENRNEDLCASDWKAKQVVVINPAGKLRFRYKGNLSSKKYGTFQPWGIDTDVLNQIVVVDWDNDCIHIIQQDGHFIRYIDNCQLKSPTDVSIYDNFLFVAEYFSGKVKKIQYLE